MRCVACEGELEAGMRFCAHCGARQPVALPSCSCGEALVPGAKFCAGCGARTEATVAPAAPKLTPAVVRPPEPSADALREYERLFEQAARDGVIEDDERDDLAQARLRLGIPQAVHERLAAGVFQGIPLAVEFDIGNVHLVEGEASVLALRVTERANVGVEAFMLRARSRTLTGLEAVSGARVPRLGAREIVLEVPAQPFAGDHAVECLLEARFVDGRALRARCALPRLHFAPKGGAGPQQVVIHQTIDNSRGVLTGQAIDLATAPASAGQVRLDASRWIALPLTPLAPEEASAWSGVSPVAKGLRPRFTGSADRRPAVRVDLQTAEGVVEEMWVYRNDTLVFGRDAARADVLLAVEPWSVPANHAASMKVSSRHLALHRTGEGVSLEDLGSSNGTSVDGARLAPGVRQPVRGRARVEVAGALTLEVEAWVQADGAAVRVRRVGNLEQRAYLVPGAGVGLWPEGVGPRERGGAGAPVFLVWQEEALALVNVSSSRLIVSGARVPAGEGRWLRAGDEVSGEGFQLAVG